MQNIDKPVDIDTSGPGAEVELDENKETLVQEQTPTEGTKDDNQPETNIEDGSSADDANAKSDEPTDVQDEKKESTDKSYS